jgi:histone deacetylase 1/2
LKNPKPTKDNQDPQKFMLKVEDSVAGFLGILMETKDNGTIELTQPGLIERIITVTGLTEGQEKFTPADTKPLGKDPEGPQCEERWSYPSVVGMLMYVASNTRPDVAFAVHQCARFTHCPKRSHEKAIKRIVRYLKGTKTKGMVMTPSNDLSLDMYADADFAGLWNAEDVNDPICLQSRKGCIITLGKSPVLWASKLQTEISLSTAEAEYIALSTGMRALLPLRRLIQEIAESLGVTRDEVSKVSCVWEDNNAALTIANSPYLNMTPRTKSIAVKYHWFRQHLIPGEIEVVRIDTKVQKADIFTKGLAKQEFESKRKMITGW